MESMGTKPRRRCWSTPEFKAELVELCLRGERSVDRAATSMIVVYELPLILSWVESPGAVRSVPPGATSVGVLVRRGVPWVSGWGDQFLADPLVDRCTDNLYSCLLCQKD